MLLIAAIGLAGVTIGVASLVLVVSFMNGAEARLAGQIASADGHVFVSSLRRSDSLAGIQQQVRRTEGVASSSASLNAIGVISVAGRSFPVDLQGPAPESAKTLFPARRDIEMIGTIPTAPRTAMLGSGLAMSLGVRLGDHVSIGTVQSNPEGLSLVDSDFSVAGIVTTGVDAFDRRRTIIPLSDLRAMVGNGAGINRLAVWLSNDADVDATTRALGKSLGSRFRLVRWRDMNRSLFAALDQERLAMIVVTSMVTLIALSNILSSMVMLVRHKWREIAILRTMGMSKGSTIRVFVGVGAAIGVAGEAFGLIVGFVLKCAKDPVVEFLRGRLAEPSQELDVLLSIPLTISIGETAWIMAAVFFGVLASTVYPAWHAATIDPAAVLRID